VTAWNVGDRVCALVSGGGYAEYCAAPAPQCLPIPAGLDPVLGQRRPEPAPVATGAWLACSIPVGILATVIGAWLVARRLVG
jgi:hypothetical protein